MINSKNIDEQWFLFWDQMLYSRALYIFASVLELVDKGDSKSPAFGRGGSSPPTGTIYFLLIS